MDEKATPLPEGAFWENEMLYDREGNLLADDLYIDPAGNLIMYEGNSERMFLDG